jgi:hypothetical protein
MNKKRIVSYFIAIALLLFVVIYGVRGLVVNIKTNEYVFVNYENLVNSPKQYRNYMIMADSGHVVNAEGTSGSDASFRILPVTFPGDGHTNGQYRFFIKFDPAKTDINTGTDSAQAVSGILRSFRGSAKNQIANEQMVAEDAFLIDSYSLPRPWYLNLLLIFIPQIFIFMLANKIYLLSKQKTPSL